MAFLREIPKVKDPSDNKQLLNYIYALEEQLRYVYANLGAENLVDGAIGAKQLQDGCITTEKLSAAAGKDLKIMSQKAVRIIAGEIEQLAKDANGNASEALQTANSFSERITDAQGNASMALQTVNGFENRVEDVEQNSAEAVLRANEAYLKVEAIEGQADYVQYTTPTGDIEIGDTWTQVAAPPTTWAEARAKNWSNTKMWGELYYNNVRYFVWDGKQWVPLVDAEEQRRVLTEVQVKADGALLKVEELAGTTPTVVRSTSAAVDLDGFHLYTGGTFDVESGNFNVDKDGNVKIKGYIEAMSGNIGGWVVAENNLHSGSGTNYVRLSTENGKPAIWAGSENADTAPFKVNKDGSMKAESGSIGGWNIAPGNLSSGSGTNHARLSTENGKPAIWAGSENADTAPFKVNKDGSMKAESGSIGGWNIAPGNLSSGSGTKHVRLSTEDATYAIWAGAEAGASAPFRVTPDGKVYLTKLYVTDENGNAQANPVNLSGNFWKMDKAYSRAVKTLEIDENTLIVELYDGTVVNFKKASDFDRLFTTAAGSGSNNVTITVQALTEFAEELDSQKITATLDTKNKRVTIGALGSTAHGDYVDCTGIYNDGWNECIDNCRGGNVLTNYYEAGETLYDRDGNVATGPWYKGTIAWRYTIPAKK